MKSVGSAAALCLAAFFVLSIPTVLADKADWQKHIDWALANHTTDPGETNCPDQYAATEPKCITGGGRACLMVRAIDSAKANNCSCAFSNIENPLELHLFEAYARWS